SEYPRGDELKSSDQRILMHYSADEFPEPTDEIVSRTVEIPNENLIFEITYDRSQFQGSALNIARAGGRGFGCVIHQDNYIYSGIKKNSAESQRLLFSKTGNEFT